MKKINFRYLSQEDILALNIPYEEIIKTVRMVMSAHGKGLCQVPPKIHVNTRVASFLNAMPAYISGDNEMVGMKWVAGYPSNRHKNLPVTTGLMILNSAETGQPLSVMDSRWITAVRTAAVAAITAQHCKIKDTHSITIIGAGEQGKWNARLMKIAVPSIRKIYIDDLYASAVKAYISKMQPLIPSVEIIPIKSDTQRQFAIDDSQILVTATQRSDKPIIYSEMLHKGMLGIPLESTAWEGKIYTRFADRFVCDDWDLVQVYLRDGKYTDGLPEEYQLLGKIINGDAVGRASEEEFVIASSHGIALSDVAVAQMIYEKAEQQNVGTIFPLMEEEDIIR